MQCIIIEKGAAPGPDNIILEDIVVLAKSGFEVITKYLNNTQTSGYITNELLKCIFICLQHKSHDLECEDRCTLRALSHGVMSNMRKFLHSIIVRSVRSKTEPRIRHVQCGFLEGEGIHSAFVFSRHFLKIYEGKKKKKIK